MFRLKVLIGSVVRLTFALDSVVFFFCGLLGFTDNSFLYGHVAIIDTSCSHLNHLLLLYKIVGPLLRAWSDHL